MDQSKERPERKIESVWDYPRPPRAEKTGRHIQVVYNDRVIADTRQAVRILETSHPPVYYIPPGDIEPGVLQPATGTTWCEWKGQAMYYDVSANEQTVARAAWTYLNPNQGYEAIKSYVAFYPHLMDACYVDGEKVQPQAGGFYGGWITSDISGPFKGELGTRGW